MIHGEWLTETLYGSPMLQFFASVALVATALVLFGVSRVVEDRAVDRFNRTLVEVAELVTMATLVVGTAFALAEIWAIPFVYESALEIVALDRWESVRGAVSVAILASSYLLVRAVHRSFDRLHTEGSITNHQKEVAYHVAGAGIFVVGGLAILSVWGIALTNLIVGAGVATAVLGLAAQRTVAAVIAGFFLLFSRPFRVGDWIEVVDDGEEAASGIVEDVTISHTKILTFNDEHLLVPNDQVTSNRLTNYTRNDRLRIDVEVGVDYETDLDIAREVVGAAAREADLVSEVRDPKTVLDRFADSAIALEVQFWIEDPSRRRALRAKTEVITAIKQGLDREGITIPFPQRTHDTRGEGFRVDVPGGVERRAPGGRRGLESGAED